MKNMSHNIRVFSNVTKIVPAVKAHARKHAVKVKVKRWKLHERFWGNPANDL